MLSDPLKPNVDLTSVGGASSGTIFDCVLQEVSPDGKLLWEWRASDHILIGESLHPVRANLQGQIVYDVFHCNSIDTDISTRHVLLSVRLTDAVYLIDKQSAKVLWKLGGNSMAADNAQILTINGDPEGEFHAQHDARFQPGEDVSLFDDQSWNAALPARGVEYHINAADGTATLLWSYTSPDGRNSGATGSFRRLYGGSDNVVGWGIHPNVLFTEVDRSGNITMNVFFTNGELAYRAIKVAPTALDHALLRATAGLTPLG